MRQAGLCADGILLEIYLALAGDLYLYIFMPREINGYKFLNSSEVAALAGIHRLTLLRWIRERKMPDVSRDRNGWRIFTEAEAADVVAYATSVNQRTSPAQTVLFRDPNSASHLASPTHA
jgi:hypothetical protein